MLSGYDADRLSSIEAEDALADEFCEWVRSWQTVPAEGSTPGRVLSGARLEGLLGIGRNRIVSVMNNRLRGERGWRQANHTVRQAWLANREHWALMGLAELEVEEQERKARAAAVGVESESEVPGEGGKQMAGTILVTDGVEKLIATTGVMDGYWSPRTQGNPANNTFPEVFCPGPEVERDLTLMTTRMAWPGWLAESSSALYQNRIGMKNCQEERQAAFEWSLRIAELLGLPVDYQCAHDLFFAKMLRLFEDYIKIREAERMAELLEAKVRGERYAFGFAQELLEVRRLTLEGLRGDGRSLPISHPIVSELSDMDMPGMIFEMSKIISVSNAQTRQARMLLREALREARVEGAGLLAKPVPECRGYKCVHCEQALWEGLYADMTASEQRVIRARVEQLDKSNDYFENYGRNFNRR